jgi:glycosyltransferase involved in cell wall biosynthesis
MQTDNSRVRHVLMTADAVGGVWTYALELARALSHRGVVTTLATMGEPLRITQREAARGIAGLELAESDFKLEWMEDPWPDVAIAGEWLLGLEERAKPDVVHLNGFCHAQLAWRVPRLVVAHSCVLSWWKAVLDEPAPAKYARYRDEVSAGLSAADAVVAPTQAMLSALDEHYGAPVGAQVISNGIDPSGTAAVAKQRFVLAAGRLWDSAKNLEALAAVAPRLSWPVVLAGSDRHPDGSVRRRRSVHALGWLEPEVLREWMARAAIYVLPARYEPFGLSVLEAALQGCALVLGDIGSLREVWGPAALYVPPDDRGALERTIEHLANDDKLRRLQSELALERARTLSAHRMAASYMDVYRVLIGRSASAVSETDPGGAREGGACA